MQKGYVLVVIACDERDEPVRDPEAVAADLVDAQIEGVVEARPLYTDGMGTYYPYGVSVVAL